jgi:MFS family permease
VCDSTVTSLPPVRMRGRVTGAYAVLVGLGLTGGPFAVSLIGAEGWQPFLLNIALAVLALVPLVGLAVQLPLPDQRTGLRGLPGTVGRHPVILLAAITCGVLEMSAAALFPVYGVSLGFPEAKAAALAGMIGVGSIVCQPLIGWLADHDPASRILPVLLAICIGGAGLLPWATGLDAVLWPLLFLWGCGVTGLYTMTLIMAGKRAGEGEIIAVITIAAMGYTSGGIIGPAVSGVLHDAFPPHGMPLGLAVLASAGAGAMLATRRPRGAPATPKRA